MRPLSLIPAFGVALILGAAFFTLSPRASATPLYSARAGRTCDNCHLTPRDWENPGLADRKCALSCQTCHVDPSGGGLRSVSGRFYGRSTLPAIATSPRPTMDWDRGFLGFGRHDRATTYTDELPLGPRTFAESRDSRFLPHDVWAQGHAGDSPTRLSPLDGRYGVLRADPLVRVGWDVRLGLIAGTGAVAFPMQIDLGVAVHPLEHLTALVNTGARGRTLGLGAVTDDPQTPYLREAFVLLHELPYSAYVKAGRFVPVYGLRLDDHTTYTRRGYEVDTSLPENRVLGVEAGLAPNYPFLQVSFFRSEAKGVAPEPFDLFATNDGTGAALSLGARKEGWSLGASGMMRRREDAQGGDANYVAAFGTLNPWFYNPSLPVVLQAEVDVGEVHSPSGRASTRVATFQEIDWRAGNGVNFLLRHDWEDPDLDVVDDAANRLQAGFQVTPLPGITLDGRFRGLFPAGGASGADFFFQVHFWN